MEKTTVRRRIQGDKGDKRDRDTNNHIYKTLISLQFHKKKTVCPRLFLFES